MSIVKIGGSEGVNFDLVCDDIADLVRQGTQLVVVHGGSHATTTLATQLGHPPTFITSPSGHTSRRTDRRTLEIFQMACRGVLNQGLVERLQKRGINAAGISGMDGRTWEGERKTSIRSVEQGRTILIRDDLSGSVQTVNPALIQAMLGAGFVPVVSPPAISVDHQPINVDADTAAARTAVALRGDALLLLSNVRGVLRRFPDESTLIERVDRAAIDETAGLVQGRMKRKVLAAGDAIRGGVRCAVIADARVPSAISDALNGRGTVFQ